MLDTVFSNNIRQTLDHFRRSVDQLFENYYGYPGEQAGGNRSEAQDFTFSPMLETAWDDNAVRLRAILPGVRQNEVNVNLQGNQLVISGERKPPEGFTNNAFTRLSYGKFSTALTLPNGLNIDKVSCRMHDGVLDIEIPLAEAMKPRQIPVESAAPQKAIGA